MKDNDDPIQELKSFRVRVENITEDDYRDDDLHNCSNDLSDEGSIKEAKGHAEFARRKRNELFNNNWQYKKDGTIKNKKNINPIAILILILIIFSTFGEIITAIIGVIDEIIFSGFTEPESSYNEVAIEKEEAIFEDSKMNIIVNTITLSDGTLALNVNNLNYHVFNNIRIQTIFYDSQNRPIKICENNINTFFENGKHLCKVNDAPKTYERVEFLITQPYITSAQNVNYEDIKLNVIQSSDGDFDIKITNNSMTSIDSLEIVAIYYKNGEIVDLEFSNVFDIESGKTKNDSMYNFNDDNSYDSMEFLINDVTIY